MASSLYLGILAGFALMWLQPFAMILGIIMLSAIGYVTLSTGERPFRAIHDHVNPVLAWGWVLAVGTANIVWCLPQYSLANGVLSKILFPGLLGDRTSEGSAGAIVRKATEVFPDAPWLADNSNKLLVAIAILVISVIITWSYDRGGVGLRIYETVLKIFVGIIVLCFVGVVVVLSVKGNLDWNAVFSGFVPDFNRFASPAATFEPILATIANDGARQYWTDVIVEKQRNVIISAAATAVGINMTFLYPYSLLRKGWTREFRGLAVFDLSTGMFIPYVLATGCVVIASASQFHTQITPDFKVNEATGQITPPAEFEKAYKDYITARTKNKDLTGEVTLEEQKVAAMLVDRKANHLSQALNDLTGPEVANYVFGIGVLAMTLSTITILMLISGFVTCEVLGVPAGGWTHRMGTLLAGVGGTLGPFIWSGASFYLAVPTSVFGFVLLPFAYITFMLLMNQNSLLGADMPKGFRRLVWNTLMFIAASLATVGSVFMVWTSKAGYYGVAALVGFTLVALLVGINIRNERRFSRRIPEE